MAPKLTVEPTSENKIIITLSSGIVIEVSDTFPLGGEIFIAETRGHSKRGILKRISIASAGTDASKTFRVEMQSGLGIIK
jgi:hypothetical protein